MGEKNQAFKLHFNQTLSDPHLYKSYLFSQVLYQLLGINGFWNLIFMLSQGLDEKTVTETNTAVNLFV